MQMPVDMVIIIGHIRCKYYNTNCRDERDGDDWSPPRSGTPPPDYTPSTADPPVYLDALQDVILSSGTGMHVIATM